MCGRFMFVSNEEALREAYPMVRMIQPSLFSQEIFPTQEVSVIMNSLDLINMRWGIPTNFTKQPIINARLETIDSKELFKSAFFTNRCLIPMTGFYEWDHNKQKYLFSPQEENLLGLAGLVVVQKKQEHFQLYTTIITKSSTDQMKGIHQRMPILIPIKDTERYLKMEARQAKKYLTEIDIEMEITAV
ncbi:MAG TPA: SOS response-associated peptidase [Erysipelothrix sp.]|nr:SOS response-associated peptidase [Erysipelothrix sp.]